MEQTQDKEVQETPEKVEISAEELEDLKKRADVSSQNFERLKKMEEEKKALEEQLQNNSDTDPDFFEDKSDLRKEIAALNAKIDKQSSSLEMDKLFVKYPALKENAEKFDTYSEDPENAGIPLASRAKAFLVENDLFEKPAPRKGLEKATGTKTTKKTSGKMTAEDAARLRTTNPRKYLAMIENGTLDIAED